MNIRQRQALTAVARGQAVADLYVRGGTLLNVYTGEVYPANVAIKGERVAYVGRRDDMVGRRTRVIDASGRVLCPGYIDPHVHPAHLITPSAMARHIVPLGTTTVFADTLQFWELGGLRAFRVAADALTRSPLRFYWMIRPHARARQGISVMLRESSLRPDLVGLLDALKAAPALVSRLMLTCDGSMPAFIEANGFMDHAVRLALDRGVPPIDAYRMATLNAATYYGLDADLGAVAPGRYADVCVLRDLAEPRPEMVIAGGRVAADRGTMLARMPEVPWQRAFTSAEARLTVRWRARAEDFVLPARDRYPVARLVSAVITRLEERPLAPGDLHAALVDRRGRWVAPAVVAGFGDERLDGLGAPCALGLAAAGR